MTRALGSANAQIDGGGSFSAGMAAARPDLTPDGIRKAMDFRRRFGGGWLAAARVAGCSEHALRLACDPDYRPVHAMGRAVTTYRPSKGGGDRRVGGTRVLRERAPRDRGPETIAAGIILALADAPMGSVALGMRVGRDKTAVNSALRPLKAQGLATDALMGDGRALRWSLTREGMAEAERLKDLIEHTEGDEA